MPTFEVVTPQHVQSALDEYDKRGGDEFLSHYGFGKAREYVLWRDGKSYDSKAILGAAYGYATGAAAPGTEFSGGKAGAARVLRDLGFDVAYVGDDSGSPDDPPTQQWMDASDVGPELARSSWATAARDVLLDTATRYQDVVTYKELAGLVQTQTGIRTKQLLQYWIGDVLGRVSAECSNRNEPLLSALCVNAEGSVGEGYGVAVQAARGETPPDLDQHAAQERLACHRHFGAIFPEGGGFPALTPRLAASRQRDRKARLAAQPILSCPTCNMELPSTGECDYCN